MKIEGEKTKRFRVFRCNSKNELLNVEFETNDPDEMRTFHRRADYLYGYMIDGKRVDSVEFNEVIKDKKL